MIQNKWLINNLFLYLIILVVFSNCKKEETAKEIPGIQDFRISKDTLVQSALNADEFLLEFTFINEKGESGFLSDTDIITMDFVDKRSDFRLPRILISPSSASINLNGVAINKGNISIRIPTTCCIYTDGNAPCERKPNIYQTVEYEFMFETNFGQTLSNQNISFILSCE